MNKDDLEKKLREVLAKHGKPQAEIDSIVPFLLSLPPLNNDEARQKFFDQWKDKL